MKLLNFLFILSFVALASSNMQAQDLADSRLYKPAVKHNGAEYLLANKVSVLTDFGLVVKAVGGDTYVFPADVANNSSSVGGGSSGAPNKKSVKRSNQRGSQSGVNNSNAVFQDPLCRLENVAGDDFISASKVDKYYDVVDKNFIPYVNPKSRDLVLMPFDEVYERIK